MSWLALDTATDRASVALGSSARTRVEESLTGARRHAARAAPDDRSGAARAGRRPLDDVARGGAERRTGELHRSAGRRRGGEGAGAGARDSAVDGAVAAGARRGAPAEARYGAGASPTRCAASVYAAAYRFERDRRERDTAPSVCRPEDADVRLAEPVRSRCAAAAHGAARWSGDAPPAAGGLLPSCWAGTRGGAPARTFSLGAGLWPSRRSAGTVGDASRTPPTGSGRRSRLTRRRSRRSSGVASAIPWSEAAFAKRWRAAGPSGSSAEIARGVARIPDRARGWRAPARSSTSRWRPSCVGTESAGRCSTAGSRRCGAEVTRSFSRCASRTARPRRSTWRGGFRPVGQRAAYYRNPKEDALVLRLELASAA